MLVGADIFHPVWIAAEGCGTLLTSPQVYRGSRYAISAGPRRADNGGRAVLLLFGSRRSAQTAGSPRGSAHRPQRNSAIQSDLGFCRRRRQERRGARYHFFGYLVGFWVQRRADKLTERASHSIGKL